MGGCGITWIRTRDLPVIGGNVLLLCFKHFNIKHMGILCVQAPLKMNSRIYAEIMDMPLGSKRIICSIYSNYSI